MERELQNLLHNIVWIRHKNGITKKKMAKILGISMKSLNRIENGEMPSRLGASTVINIYRTFGIKPKTLFEQRMGL